jgi:hypothetical protein
VLRYQQLAKIYLFRYASPWIKVHSPVTGDLSPFVSVSALTSFLNTDAVSPHARETAAIATCFSRAYAAAMIFEVGAEERKAHKSEPWLMTLVAVHSGQVTRDKAPLRHHHPVLKLAFACTVCTILQLELAFLFFVIYSTGSEMSSSRAIVHIIFGHRTVKLFLLELGWVKPLLNNLLSIGWAGYALVATCIPRTTWNELRAVGDRID